MTTQAASPRTLELTEVESARMQRDLNAILDYVAQLNELDTTSVQPMAQVGEQFEQWRRPDQPETELRGDELRASLDRTEVLKAAPETDGIFFKVPRVIER